MDVKDELMYNLKQLVEATHARIVWTTYWRGFRAYLDFVLYRFEMGPSIGATLGATTMPGGPTAAVGSDRAQQIAAFLDDHGLAGSCPYVILDDREVSSVVVVRPLRTNATCVWNSNAGKEACVPWKRVVRSGARCAYAVMLCGTVHTFCCRDGVALSRPGGLSGSM